MMSANSIYHQCWNDFPGTFEVIASSEDGYACKTFDSAEGARCWIDQRHDGLYPITFDVAAIQADSDEYIGLPSLVYG